VTIFVLDSSAVLRYIDNEAGGDRVKEILKNCVRRQAAMRISALQWGEVAGHLRKRLGNSEGKRALDSLLPFELEVIPATGERAVRAAELRSDRRISYVDAFAVELATNSSDHVLVTADYDFNAVDDLVRVEFLPAK
jgi:predicted nucleic acid-binding protein